MDVMGNVFVNDLRKQVHWYAGKRKQANHS